MDGDLGPDHSIIFFDGICNLCNSFISFVVWLKPQENIKVSSLQGETAKKLLSQEEILGLRSVIYLKSKEFNTYQKFEKTEAVIRILIDLKPYFFPFKTLIMIPAIIRDSAYNFIANNRYRFFGKKDTCRLPTEEERGYFLP